MQNVTTPGENVKSGDTVRIQATWTMYDKYNNLYSAASGAGYYDMLREGNDKQYTEEVWEAHLKGESAKVWKMARLLSGKNIGPKVKRDQVKTIQEGYI